MRSIWRPSVVTVAAAGGSLLVFTGTLPAAGKRTTKTTATPTPAPALAALPEKPTPINPELSPSLSLGPFLDTHLDRIVAPLDGVAFIQPEVVEALKTAYANALTNAPEARKPAYVLAISVCGALTDAMKERVKAAEALAGLSQRPLMETATPPPTRGRGKKPAATPSADATFFAEGQKNNWRQKAAAFKQRILALYIRERGAEAQAGVWPLPTPPPTPTPLPSVASAPKATPGPAPASTPSVSALATSAADPVIGDWKWAGRSKVRFNADNTITGARLGTWVFLSVQDAGRCYAVYWSRSGIPDSVIMTGDGKSLKGRTRAGKEVEASR